jgi:hypothetical protein
MLQQGVYLLLERRHTVRRHPVAQEIQFLGPKLAFLAIDDQTEITEPLEQELEMLQMRCQVRAAHDDVIQVHKDEGEAVGYPIHHPLEGVAGVAEAKTHPQKLVQAKRRDDGSLGNIPGVHGDLMVALAQIHLAEDAASGHLCRKVHHIRQWV